MPCQSENLRERGLRDTVLDVESSGGERPPCIRFFDDACFVKNGTMSVIHVVTIN